MDLTDEEKIRAIKISQALQYYFDNDTSGRKSLRSTDAYNLLLRTGLVERDDQEGILFRIFLKRLKEKNALNLIPQLRIEIVTPKLTHWFFESSPSKTIKNKNLRPVPKPMPAFSFDEAEIVKQVLTFKKKDRSEFTYAQLAAKEEYSRAYEYWEKEEDALLMKVVKEIKDPNRLADLFGRQPSAIKSRLQNRFGIVL
jgi:hypothetical protein